MEVYYLIVFFILGTVLASFYNVVGYRLPKGESIIYPRSHCPNCKHDLSFLEMIPILSFVIQKGRCKNCQTKIAKFYPIIELSGGILFSLAYLSFGMTLKFLLAITFISMVLIIFVSDYHYLIIPDSVLIITGILLLIEIYLMNGLPYLLNSIINGVISFMIMFLIKKLGDFLFKKESMGGGDIKLMFIFGLIFGYKMVLVIIFLASVIGLPISLVVLYKNNNHVLPFGPYLCLAALIILLFQINDITIYNLLIR